VHFAKKWLKRSEPSGKMTKRSDLGLKTLLCTNWCALLKSVKSGAPSAKLTKHADFVLKPLFCSNSCAFLKIAEKWCAQCENDETYLF